MHKRKPLTAEVLESIFLKITVLAERQKLVLINMDCTEKLPHHQHICGGMLMFDYVTIGLPFPDKQDET